MMVKTVVDSGRYRASNIVPTPIQFSPVNIPGALWIEDSQPHEYFLHLFGKLFLDGFIAERNLLEGKILPKGYLGNCSQLGTYRS